MSNFTALYDANVLYPASIRDLLMWLTTTDLFRAKWSAQIHEEWISSLLKGRPDLTLEKLDQVRQFMDESVPDCLVEGYKELIEALTLPDANDRHVLAAAIRGRANAIVTYNVKHFPLEILAKYGIEVQHPDEFVAHLIDLSPYGVLVAVRKMRQNLKNPLISAEDFVTQLEERGLTETAAFLRNNIGSI